MRHGISSMTCFPAPTETDAAACLGAPFLGKLFADIDRREEARESLMKAQSLYREMAVSPQFYWYTRMQKALERSASTIG
jgi:hypothetical protein